MASFITPQQINKHIEEGGQILDVRHEDEFTSGFISGSIFLQTNASFPERLVMFLDRKKPVVVISDAENTDEILSSLAQNGFADVRGCFSFHQSEFADARLLDMVIAVDPDEFAMDLKFDEAALAVDLRPASDFLLQHIAHSVSAPFIEFADVARIAALDEEGIPYFYSGEEHEAVTTASLFKRHSLHDLRVVSGGWDQISREKTIELVSAVKKKKQ